MLSDKERAFLGAYAAIAAADVVAVLEELAIAPDDYREMCGNAAFIDRLHGMFASLEVAPEPDPLAFPPLPPIVCDAVGVSLAIDPYGPLFGGFAYNHTGRCFGCGKRMSEVLPSEVEWFNAAASWPKPTK